MSFQTPITIEEAVRNVYQKKYLLPSIQREVVWDIEQIEKLFDSLLRDYPIGSFLFWYVDKKKTNRFQFYEFIRDYHERLNKHNAKANVSGEDDIIGILDGQQRLTSLYLGLRGSYSYKEPWKRKNNEAAYLKRYLYLNLLSPNTNEERDMYYDFQFLTEEEAKAKDDKMFWFRVGDILDIKTEAKVNEFLIKNKLLTGNEEALFANETLFKLHTVVFKSSIINYFLEKDESLDKVLNIFIRVNSGGTPLSYSDLLLSIASAQWSKKDAREEIHKFVDDINNIGNGFNFDKDFVLKSCLVLSNIGEIAFKVDNFNRENMKKIESEWENITEAIDITVRLASSFGYNRETLTSANALIPIAIYIMKKKMPHNFVESRHYHDDRQTIQRWLAISLLKRIFSGQPDNVLRPLRQIISKNHSSFPLDTIITQFKGKPKSFGFNNDEVDNLFEYPYGSRYTFPALALLYPTFDFRNKFHVDHIHPKSLFTEKRLKKSGISDLQIPMFMENFNFLANLQLLEGTPNQEKNDTEFDKWVLSKYSKPQEQRDYFIKNFIPDIDIELKNFKLFIKKRREIMTDQYRTLLVK